MPDTEKNAPVTAIKNIGPAMARHFAKAGLDSAEAVIALGPDRAYARLIATGHRAHFMAYVALVLGLAERPWHDLGPAEKAALRSRFDAIKAGRILSRPPVDGTGDALPPALDDTLRRIGLID
ncbi:MAG: TfoX/Sxy family DNA transformation protein [Pseudomonadota bacterium]